MTISSTTRKAGPFTGNGSASAFPFAFKVFAASDLYVVRLDSSTGIETVLTLTTDYTVSLNADQNANPGGTITLVGGALATGYTLTLTSNINPLQQTDLTNQGGFYPAVITNALDKLTILVQQLYESTARTLKVAVSTPAGVNTTLPSPEANKLIGWNPTADNLQNMDPTTLATIVAFGTANSDLFSGDGSTTQFALSANPGALNNLDVSIGGVSQRPGIDYTWVSGTTISFTNAPPSGTNNVLVRYMQGLPSGIPGDGSVTDSKLASDPSVLDAVVNKLKFLAAGAGAAYRSLRDKLRDQVTVADYGADATGTTDSSAAFQAAINAAAARGGGTVWVEPGLYKISTALTTTKAVLLRGTVRTDISSNTNGGGFLTAKPTILWTGSAGAYMYTIHPAVVGDCVWGGGSIDIEWNGNDLAAVGVWLDNTKYAVFDGKVRQVTYAGVLVNSASGAAGNFSMKNHIRSLEFVWGTVAACQNAHGLLLGGNGSTVPATQQLVGDVSGLVYNGSLVHVTETDNAQFLSVHGTVQSPGTGVAVNLVNAGAQGSNHNFFVYCVGPVKLDNGLVGNVFLNYNSEGGGITQLIGSSSWDGELVDYGTGERFTSHKYALRDKITLTSGDFVGDITTARDSLAFQWVCVTLNDATTMTASCIIPAPYWLSAGVIEAVEFYVGTNGTSAGNYRLTYKLSTGTLAGAAVTPERTDTVTVAAGAQYTPTKLTWTPSTELPFAKGDHIFLTIQRLGADALDTNSDAMMLIGARILYRSSGPTTSGSGSYSIPAWS